jgi:hypothetical protein
MMSLALSPHNSTSNQERRTTMGRKPNFSRVAIAFGMLALLGLPVRHASAHASEKTPPVPFMLMTTQDFFTITGIVGSLVYFTDVQSGQATYFGQVSTTAIGTLDLSTGALSGTITFATANGDLVYGTVVGTQSGLTDQGMITFTGGTGLFDDLRGSATFQSNTNATTGVATVTAQGRVVL